MKDIAIRVENLGKLYRIGQKRTRYETLRDRIALFARSPLRHLKYFGTRLQKSETDFIWAIKDVSFEVRRGEVVGIIGRNGAGKSTLLKILSRITEPTEGYAEIHGRVGSLLEVGTGFHPELTGRENIYLNGAILGMKKAEIDRKFDEIVAFAEIEKFLDTPVKRYSSGMYVRLAFAVAAHLEPEILLVDEVLAVGDAAFQKKCLGKMGDVAKEGRTVLFVSHHMGAISSLCREVMWIDEGHIRLRGKALQIIGHYLMQGFSSQGEINLKEFPNRNNPGPAYISWAATKNAQDIITNRFQMGDKLIVEFEICSERTVHRIGLSVSLKTSTGIPVLHLVDRDFDFTINELHGSKRVRVTIPSVTLYPGSYLLSIWIGDPMGHDYDYVVDCLSINVIEGNLIKRSGISWSQAVVTCQSHWEEVETGR